jgi:adenine-specific DNA-methyltransferase
MAKTDFSKWTKEQLIDEVAKLRKRKKYGLLWEPSKENVVEQCKTELPVLKEIKNKTIAKDKKGATHILIEGDNYHALSVLNYTHKGKVDVVYIDPPYNTGSGDFMYNDKYVNAEDTYRHSKWLSFMSARLRLAKNLLKHSGVLLVQIDDNEIAQLKLLMDEIFGEDNFRNSLIWAYRTGGAPSKKDVFSRKHDYILFYSKSKDGFFFNKLKEKIIYQKNFFGAKKDKEGNFYAEVNLRDFFEGEFTLMKDGALYKNMNVKPVLNLSSERVESFPSQKPSGLMKFLFEVLAPKDAVVLDFFAGSGSTALSTLQLKKERGDNPRFILCTNNENNICTDFCYPRVKKLLKDYGGNLRYFKTSFVKAEPSDKNKKLLTHEATEMLCMREDTFEPVKETKNIKIFKNAKQHTAIVFDEDSIPALKKEIAKIGGAWSVYIFSLGDDTFEDEFQDMGPKITVAPIPEVILRVYRRIFKA